MTTAKEQLLSKVSPQAARLLDQQMRSQQVGQRAQGAGMLSGLVQAYTGMADQAQRVGGVTPMGANELDAIRQQELLKKQAAEEEAKKAEMADNIADANAVLTARSVTALEAIRDKAIAKNTAESAAVAQKAQKKIDALREQIRQSGATEKTVDAALDIVAKSDLPESMLAQISEEVTSGITKPQDINKRIESAQQEVVKGNKLSSGIAAIESFDLTDKEKMSYTYALKGGASLTSILQKVIPAKRNLTVDRLSQMYRFFTPESVDKFKKAIADGVKTEDLPALVEQDSTRKVRVSSVTKTMINNFKDLVQENFEDPDVKAVFSDEGVFFEDPDLNKIKAFVADVYTYANKNELLLSQALVEYSRNKNAGGGTAAISNVTEEDINRMSVEELEAFIKASENAEGN